MPTTTVPTITLSPSVAKDPGLLVVGLADASEGEILVGLPEELAKAFVKTFGTDLAAIARQLGGSAKAGRVVLVPGPGGLRVVVVGLGPIDVTPEQVRRAAGAAARLVAGLGGTAPLQVTISLETAEPQVIKGAAEGALLGAYSYRPAGPDTPGSASSCWSVPTASRRPGRPSSWPRPRPRR